MITHLLMLLLISYILIKLLMSGTLTIQAHKCCIPHQQSILKKLIRSIYNFKKKIKQFFHFVLMMAILMPKIINNIGQDFSRQGLNLKN